MSTRLSHTQRYQFIGLKDHLETYCNVLPVFGYNSAEHDLIFTKSYSLHLLDNVRGIEPIVIKKSNQFVSSKLGDVQLLDILNFPGGATSLDFFLQAYRTSETKDNFP